MAEEIDEDEKIRICPECGSIEVDYATQLGGANIGGGDHFYCKTCDYGRFQQVVFDEIKKSDVKHYRAKLKK